MSFFCLVISCEGTWASYDHKGRGTSKSVNYRGMDKQKRLNQQKKQSYIDKQQEATPHFSGPSFSIKPQYVVPVLLVASIAGYYMLTNNVESSNTQLSSFDLDCLRGGHRPSVKMSSSIPVTSRAEVYTDLEKQYCQGELCDGVKDFCEQALDTKTKKGMKDCCASFAHLYQEYDSLVSQSFPLEDKSCVKIVPQGAYYIGDSGKIITGNLQKCVGVAIYNAQTRQGGVAHLDADVIKETDLFLSGRTSKQISLQNYLSEIVGKSDPSQIKIMLVSGYKAHIEYVARFMAYFGLENIERVHNELWANKRNSYYSKGYTCGSIALDLDNEGSFSRVSNIKELSDVMGPTLSVRGYGLLPMKKMQEDDF